MTKKDIIEIYENLKDTLDAYESLEMLAGDSETEAKHIRPVITSINQNFSKQLDALLATTKPPFNGLRVIK